MIKHDQAISFLTNLLRSGALVKGEVNSLKKLYLHGAAAEHEQGKDIDIILEVDEKTFDKYRKYCKIALDGVHPISHHFGFGALWDDPSSSPKGLRTKAAFQMVGLDIERFLSTMVPDNKAKAIRLENIDAICLPEGWCDRSGDVSKALHEKLKQSGDATFLIHAIRSKREITA